MKEQKIEQVFLAQDQILRTNIDSFEPVGEAYALVSDACYLVGRLLRPLPFEEEKKHVLVSFAGDAISSVIVATRVALWGDFAESMSTLRPAIERAAQLLFIVGDQKYKTAKYEMQSELKQTSYENAVRAMGSFGAKADSLRGLISGLAAHASAKRFNWSIYEKDGADFLRFGFSRDTDHVLLTLYYCIDVPMLILHAIQRAYEQDDKDFSAKGEVDQLLERLGAVKAKMNSVVETWKAAGVGK